MVMERHSFKEYQDVLDQLNLEMRNTPFFQFLEKIWIKKEIDYLGSQLEDVYVNSSEFWNLLNSYKEVVSHVVSLFKELDILDPVKVFSVYSYLIRSGFLSYQHQFVYNKMVDDGIYLLGSNVISGEGVCRHICSFLTDIYQKMGYVSCNISMVANKDLESMEKKKYPCIVHDEKRSLKGRLDDFFYFISTGGAPYNHLVTLVKDSHGTLLMDPTNDIVFFVGASKDIFPVIEKDIYMNCTYMPLFNSDIDVPFSSFLKTTDSDVVQGIFDKYDATWNFCEKNSGLFEYFYCDNYDLYQDVVRKRKVLIKEFKRNMD